MTRLATTPEVFRGTSRTLITEAELVAAFRIHLRDAGWPRATALTDAGVRLAVAEVQREALRLGRDPLEHLFALKADRYDRMHAPRCQTCGATRPPTWKVWLPKWGVTEYGAACPDCLAGYLELTAAEAAA